MKNLMFLLLTIFLSANLLGQITSDDRLKGIDEEVEQLLKEYNAAGLAVAVIEKGETIYSKGFGYKDFNNKVPVDEHTIFGIGSVTKSFTAGLLGILEGQGKMSLSARPRTYIPELKFYNSTMDDEIRVADILTHSTGISRMISESSCILFQSDNKSDLVSRLEHLKPEAKVREAWLYSNYMYTIAGLISERVNGKSWEENLSELIFQPLSMDNTYAGVLNAKKDKNYSRGYAVENGVPIEVLPETITTRAPAGDIYSSVHDMEKWVKAWMNDGQHNKQPVLPTSYVKHAMSPKQIMWQGMNEQNTSVPQFSSYGYGWMSSNYHGYYKVEHSGGISGYTSNVAFFPNEKTGIIVLTNQTGSSLSYSVTDMFLERLLSIKSSKEEPDPVRFTENNIIQPAATKTIPNESKPPTHSLMELTGNYHHPGFGTVRVSYKNETLYADFPFTTFRLAHVHYNVFQEHFTEEVPLAMWPFMNFNFTSDAAGQVNNLWISFEPEATEFKRVTKGAAANVLKDLLDEKGSAVAIKTYWTMKNSEVREYDFSENDLNALGYQYLTVSAIEKAIVVFELNVESYPESFNAYDSLGEAFMKKGDKEKAIYNYKKSITLNPDNQNGIEMLRQLGVSEK